MSNKEKSNHLGKYLRELREALGFTLEEVEELSIGLEYEDYLRADYISKCELNRFKPSTEKLNMFARVYNVDVNELHDMIRLDALGCVPVKGGDYETLMKEGRKEGKKGEYKQAVGFFRRALRISQSEKNAEKRVKMEIESRGNLAICLFRLGCLSPATRECKAILKYKDCPPEQVTQTLKLRGEIERADGEYRSARAFLKEALSCAEKREPIRITILSSLGSIELLLENYDLAESYYLEAVSMGDEINDPHRKSVAEVNLGYCYIEKGEIEKGKDVLEGAIGFLENRENKKNLAQALVFMLIAGYKSKDYDHVRTLGKQIVRIAADKEYDDIEFQARFYLWQTARQQVKKKEEGLLFKKLRILRKHITKTFPELEEFDKIRAEERLK